MELVLDQFVDFYDREPNEKIPRSALNGATPYEAITSQWTEADEIKLRQQRADAQKKRIDSHIKSECKLA